MIPNFRAGLLNAPSPVSTRQLLYWIVETSQPPIVLKYVSELSKCLLAKCWQNEVTMFWEGYQTDRFSYNITQCRSGGMVDAPVSKTGGGNPVSVRL